MSDVNFQIDNPEIKTTLRAIAGKIQPALPKGWGFMLMIFEYGKESDPGSNFYLCSADRADMVKVLQEWIARQPEEVRNG